ncbi:MAG TPA: SDR family oxidoreductase [Oscillospiraceae bacterium]|nr:SDR family oxidoreductase [Oscillospiraceae bacterium]HPF55395.1 SDR family oxidoreductase [Clostridiales bacterium]HPK35607.1 SDR family oxidoreductase [Oscillospiraceae bacterium]HPR74671.1 SDR family oxidoreductase [Oscillospiraceae bacterium]
MKTALITGASSGLGSELAKQLSDKGWRTILVARRVDRLEELAKILPGESRVIPADLGTFEGCKALFDAVADENIDLLINNAGFGLFGEFTETELDRELAMVDLNCKALHTLMKLFLTKMTAKNSGTILNVASVAAYMIGPLMATYYATKGYVLKLSQSVDAELRKSGSKVRVLALCPGPFDTEFNEVAGVSFGIRGKSAQAIARTAIKGIERGKSPINPGFLIKFARIGARISPDRLLADICYRAQKSKSEK